MTTVIIIYAMLCAVLQTIYYREMTLRSIAMAWLTLPMIVLLELFGGRNR